MTQILRPMITLKEVAKLLRISERTARNYLKNYPERMPKPVNLTPSSIRGTWRFCEDDVYSFLTKGNTSTIIRDE